MADFLVVGLGNPGPEYAKTRHNVGAEVVEILARRHGGSLKRSRAERALVGDVRIAGKRVTLAVPLTYMNESGMAVGPLVRYAAVTPEHLIVVHDELDLEPAALRVKNGGGLAGHNGLRSIVAHLKTQDFTRVRIGVGKPPGGASRGVDHVLKRFGKAEREHIDVTLELAADAIESIIDVGVDPTMNRYNTKA